MLHRIKFAALLSVIGIFYLTVTLIALSIGLVAEALHGLGGMQFAPRRLEVRVRRRSMIPVR